jgi:hypothetical protein
MKNYIIEFLCRFLDVHFWGEWENKSKFIDTGVGFNFGWVARWGHKCRYCGRYKYSTPFLASERERMIEEANEKCKY